MEEEDVNGGGLGVTLCDGPLWDPSLFWDSESPRFTYCFRRLLLTVIPCSVLWLATLLDEVLRRRCGHPHICGPCPLTLLTICKQVLTCCLILCTASEGIHLLAEHKRIGVDMRIEYLFVCIRLVTYILALWLQIRLRRRGKLSSMKLTLFWTTIAVCDIFASPLYNLLTDDFTDLMDDAQFVFGIIAFSLVVAEAFMSHFTDPQYDALFKDSKSDEFLVDHQSPLSRLLFSWVNRTMKLGYKNVLTVEDLDTIRPDTRTTYVCDQFLTSWAREEEIARETKKINQRWWQRGPSLSLALARIMWPWVSAAIFLELIYDFVRLVPPIILEKKINQRWWQRGPSLSLALARIMWPWVSAAIFLELIYDFVRLVPPIILDWLITYMSDANEPWWHGFTYALFLFVTTIFYSLLLAHVQNFLIRASIMPKSGLSAAIYRKVFKLSLESRRGYSAGELCNLLTVDTQRIFELLWSINMIWSNPLQIILIMVLLWRYLGVACVAGLVALLVLMPLTALLAFYVKKLQKIQMELKDNRLRQMNEILNGIKVLKLFAWELPFMRRVKDVRLQETRSLRTLAFLNGVVTFLWILAPFLVALCSFIAFVLMDENNVLDPSIAFVSLTLFGRLRGALNPMPQAIVDLVQSRIAFGRVSEFLLSEELDKSDQEDVLSPDNVLELENASFSWGTGDSFLQDLNLSVKNGSLIAIVGRVGAGKSALLSALLGEMNKSQGNFRIQKDLRVAYVSQTAWIQNATLRQNVLFVSPYDKRRYDSVIRRCCLGPDLRTLPGSDHTEIGEKGVNLSGGQKQRVNLARAVYHDADIYLLDDPLSAVDAHVSQDLFSGVIGPKGKLAHKTRILVTHDLSVLPYCDTVLLMSDGRIVESGSYKDLLKMSSGHLSRLVVEFSERERATSLEEIPPSPEPSLLTPEEIKAQMKRLASRQFSVENIHQAPSSKKTRFIEKERIEVGRVRAGVYWTYFRNAGLLMTSLMFSGFAAHQALEIGSNVWLGQWSSDPPLPDGTQDVPLRNLRMGVYGGFGLAQGACILLGTALLALASTRASVQLHKTMLWRVMRSPLHFFETTPLGRILNRFGNDFQNLDLKVPLELSAMMRILAALIGTIVVISTNYPYFLLVLVPIAILYVFMQLLYSATVRQMPRLYSTTLSCVLSCFSESVQGTSVIRAYGCQSDFTKKQDSLMDENCKVYVNRTTMNRWMMVRLQLIAAIVIFAVALLAVFQRFQYSAAIVGLTLSYSLNVTDLLGQLVRTLTLLEVRMVSVERIDEYSRLEEEASWDTDRCRLQLTDWPSQGHVVFRDYKMRYGPNCDFALKGIDLEILAGQKVGVVGRTGAGKTSLALALFRVVEPTDGYLFIDGVDVATLGLHDLRSKLTVIPQDPVLFGGDLRLNLDPLGRHTDEEVLDSVRMARMNIPAEGLSTHMDEGGGNLSVGQRQQVCLARALLQRSRILVLDEATAAMDLETDRLIQETIREEFSQCTVITVAHRLHTVLDYDRILVMDSGRIVEDGPPDVLLKKSDSKFKKLAQAAGLL